VVTGRAVREDSREWRRRVGEYKARLLPQLGGGSEEGEGEGEGEGERGSDSGKGKETGEEAEARGGK